MSKLERILYYFPEVELPIIVSEEQLPSFEASANPFPQAFVDEILTEWEGPQDDFTEFSPCFRIPRQELYSAVIYWKASLLRYDFILATFDKNGNLINKKSIASTVGTDTGVQKSVASIEPDHIIHIIAGQSVDGNEYDPSDSKVFSMEIMADGAIVFHEDTISQVAPSE